MLPALLTGVGETCIVRIFKAIFTMAVIKIEEVKQFEVERKILHLGSIMGDLLRWMAFASSLSERAVDG